MPHTARKPALELRIVSLPGTKLRLRKMVETATARLPRLSWFSPTRLRLAQSGWKFSSSSTVVDQRDSKPAPVFTTIPVRSLITSRGSFSSSTSFSVSSFSSFSIFTALRGASFSSFITLGAGAEFLSLCLLSPFSFSGLSLSLGVTQLSRNRRLFFFPGLTAESVRPSPDLRGVSVRRSFRIL